MSFLHHRISSIILLLCFTITLSSQTAAAKTNKKFTIGVTLHPYYSWVANIVGESMEILTVIPENSDPHTYQARPRDLENLKSLDAIIVNGLGHDNYIDKMLEAAGKSDIRKIKVNKGIPLIPSAKNKYAHLQETTTAAYNSHTYVAITSAIQQINTITQALSQLQPQHKSLYQNNSRQYIKRLRNLLRQTLKALKNSKTNNRNVATVHDGYAYMFQELGIHVQAVIQPRHGIEPSAKQLADTIKRIKEADITILFSELNYKKRYVETIFQETGCRIYTLSHISNGPYTVDKFETEMRENLQTLVTAFSETPTASQ